MTTPILNLDYGQSLEINKHDLPGEWEKQPQLYTHWAEQWAYAVQIRDQAKDNVDWVKANIDSNIRADPSAYGFAAKPTETAISSAILKHADYGAAIDALHEANLNVNLLAGAKTGMEHKKRALESLTQLLVNEFYQSAGVPSEAVVASGKKTQSKQKRSLAK